MRMSLDNPESVGLTSNHFESIQNLIQKLTGRPDTELHNLIQIAPSHFRCLTDRERNEAIVSLGLAACRLSSGHSRLECPVCDAIPGEEQGVQYSSDLEILLDTLELLHPQIDRRPDLYPVALEAYRRLLNHVNSSQRFKLVETTIGKFVLRLLRSPSRDTRLKAATLLQVFAKQRPDGVSQTIRDNCIAILEYLQSLWQTNKSSLQETVVIALVKFAEVVGDDELNIVLLRLVEYLAHPNVYIAGLVASELLQLSHTLDTNMQGLLRPFWRTISVVIIRNFIPRPMIAQQVCELLGMEMFGLLHIMEEHALPYLVLNGQVDVISKIASSSALGMNAFDICVKPANLPKILAALLMQAFQDPEETIMKILIKISPDFGEQDLPEWLGLDPSKIAFELLKAIGDAGSGKGSKIFQGLQLLAQLSFRKTSGSAAGRRSGLVSSFLENKALEIVTLFTTTFDDNVLREMNVERRRCLVGLGELVKIGRGRISAVIPQICACLRSAVADPALSDAAYGAWMSMISSLDEDGLSELLDQTLAITVRYWSILNSDSHCLAQTGLSQLFQKHQPMLRECADMLPSLKSIPTLSELDEGLEGMKQRKEELGQFNAFVARIQNENMIVAQVALVDLVEVLRQKYDLIQRSLTSEQPDTILAEMVRAILDCAVKFNHDGQVVLLAAQCLGAIGCVDSSRLESTREKPTMILLSNFAIASETTAFLMFFMEQVVVKEYVSASSLRSKTFLGWALQELLKLCQLSTDVASRTRVGGFSNKDRQWLDLSGETRLVLTPFLTSRFLAPGRRPTGKLQYPIFNIGINFEKWLTDLTLDLLQKGLSQNIDFVFEVCWKMVYFSHGTAIASFLLPYAVLNLLLNGSPGEKEELLDEVLCLLQQPYDDMGSATQETIRQCSQTIFEVLDYLSKWLQDKRKWHTNAQSRAERGLKDPALDTAVPQMESVETLLKSVPPQVITQRSIECRSYARALLHWEEYIHSKPQPTDEDYRKLQDIYAKIDEPDGIEGISSCMRVLNAEAQILEHAKAGRWQAVQNWYEMQMTEVPDSVEIQANLFHALRESGQNDVLLHHFDGMVEKISNMNSKLLPYAIEASWSTAQFETMSRFVDLKQSDDFTTHLASEMLSLRSEQAQHNDIDLDSLWLVSARDLSFNSTKSLSACTDTMLKMHVAEDLRLMIAASADSKNQTLDLLADRLEVLGTNLAAKHYVLNVHRAAMHLRTDLFTQDEIAASWLKTAKLARKAQASSQAFNAILRAASLGDQSAVIEQAKLMWLENRHRKAIQTLEAAIESGAFNAHTYLADKDTRSGRQEQNTLTARAYVLLGKWLDQAGQTQSEMIIKTLRKSTEQNRMWESGWYHLGRYYNRILESERSKPPGKESQPFLTGEAAKTVIDNFLRALACGNKYLFQTLPKMLTLWLELASHPDIEQDARRGNSKFHEHLATQRKKVIAETNAYVKKYVERLQPVTLYTILPQLVARICHQSNQIHEILQGMIAKIVQHFPQQALWTLMAMTKSTDKMRAQRGLTIINKVVELQKRSNKNAPASELRTMISAAQRFTDELLRVADYHIEGKVPKINLGRDLGFNHKIAPSKLVVPAEVCLIPNIPTSNDATTLKTFRAFSKDPITITAFLDEALVLPSLQKPRKMSIRGSDGHVYSILAKPKDDLRKDQRLMEFGTMINRFLKRDIDASKRRLYIRTYAVIPLNEECGLIEWVNNLKTMRDVLLRLYRERNVSIDYGQLRHTLDDICAHSENKAKDYTERVLPLFPPVLRYWFIEMFPDPSAWLQARVRFTRSAAVMSIVGHILGLGDRHGENILFEEDNGGVMHVDFNCLFDKGLTFDKPEMVPFRLTHNMVDAFGPFGVEGPFRKCCEITMSLLRNHEDGLMTILETFLHDPTTDFMTAGKRKKRSDLDGIVPDTAEKMLEGVKGKLRGMLVGESVPLSVGGYVEEMVKQASDRSNLARMYIGWCAFL